MFNRYSIFVLFLIMLLFACTPSPSGDGISATRDTPADPTNEIDESILDKDWFLTEMNLGDETVKVVGVDNPVFIRFGSEENTGGEGFVLTGNGGCNGFGGGYAGISNQQITLYNVANTEMGCLGSLEQEMNFFNLLYSGDLRYELQGDDLLIHAGEAGLLRFSQAQPSTTVMIRLHNVSDADMTEVMVSFPNMTQTVDSLPSGEMSDYFEVDLAYRYAGIRALINGTQRDLSVIDYVGETPLTAGQYTYNIHFDNSGLGISLADFEPDLDGGNPQTNIEPLLTQLGITESTNFTGDSLFNELFQADVSDTWELNLNGESVLVYAFQDAALAELAVTTISPDGSMFTGVTDGSPVIQVDFVMGTIPRYWLQDTYLVYYFGENETTLAKLDETFGTRVADAANPSSRHPEQPGTGIAGTTIEGVSLQYDPYLAYAVTGNIVDEPDGSQYLLINLDTDNFPLIFPPQIQISTRDTNLTDWMPADAPRTEVVDLTFQNGTGQRWLVQMGDGFGYFAEGKTSDGKYTATLMFPTTAAKNGFIPDLALLDAVFSSFTVDPDFD